MLHSFIRDKSICGCLLVSIPPLYTSCTEQQVSAGLIGILVHLDSYLLNSPGEVAVVASRMTSFSAPWKESTVATCTATAPGPLPEATWWEHTQSAAQGHPYKTCMQKYSAEELQPEMQGQKALDADNRVFQ